MLTPVLREHYPAMLRRAGRLLKDNGDAADVVQDVVERLLNAPHLLAPVEHLGGYLLTMVANQCMDLLRRGRRVSLVATVDPSLEDPGESAQDRAEQQELYQWLAKAVDSLSPELRQVFTAHALEGRTFSSISKETGIPMGTLMARKKRAMDQIRDTLKARGLL